MHYGLCENGEWIKISVQLRMFPHRYRKLKLERWNCHDIINYWLMERICKKSWKRPSSPSTEAAWPRGEYAGACNPGALSSTPPYPRSYVCIIHDETKSSRGLNITRTPRGLNWEKIKHTSWQSLSFDPNKSRFFWFDLLKSSNTYWISG